MGLRGFTRAHPHAAHGVPGLGQRGKLRRHPTLLPDEKDARGRHNEKGNRVPDQCLAPCEVNKKSSSSRKLGCDDTPDERCSTLKSLTPRASLRLPCGLGGYIRRMRSRAPTGKTENITNAKPSRLILGTSLQLPPRLRGY
jgi:hypothetical protein